MPNWRGERANAADIGPAAISSAADFVVVGLQLRVKWRWRPFKLRQLSNSADQ